MLLHFGIVPYLVFDGDYLPSKSKIEVDRAKRREESKSKGMELYRLNRPSQAHMEFQKAVDVTPEMARQLIEELKKIGVKYVVAPYEADAQLVYLERKGVLQGMISEDSDLLVFGAKRLLTKLDQYGECVEVNRADFTSCRDISLVGWSDAEFRRMAILSGCDYLASINRMGIKSAYRLVRKYKTIEKIIRMLQFDGQYHVPTGYLEAFNKAEMTFLYQRVFCPQEGHLVTMSELEAGLDSDQLPFIGADMEQSIALGVARGDLDPMTKTPISVTQVGTSSTPNTPCTPWGKTFNNENYGQSDKDKDKDNKSIEQFFKPTRTPLAELDPNKFTPSPTQQWLLQQASGRLWEPSEISGDTPTQPARSLAASTVPDPRSRNQQRDLSTSQSPSLTGLPRKRRFDSESSLREISRKPQSVEGTRSRFFANGSSTMPLSSKRKRNGVSKKSTDFTVWSDDSTEGAMLELVNHMTPSGGLNEVEPVGGEEQMSLPSLGKEKESQERATQKDTQSSSSSRDTMQSEISRNTIETSLTSPDDSAAETLDRNVTSELSALTKKYAFAEGDVVTSSAHVTVESSRISDQRLQDKPMPPSVARSSKLSPLQRLGACALRRSKSSASVLSTRGREESNEESEMPNLTSNQKFRRIGSVPNLKSSHTIGPDASSVRGSEDALVPCSEEEDERVSESVSEVENTPPKPRISLGQYAFNG